MRLDDSSISLGLERMTECSGPISNACILHTDQVVSEKLILSASKAGTNKTRRIKVKKNKKRCLEFSGLYLGQEVMESMWRFTSDFTQNQPINILQYAYDTVFVGEASWENVIVLKAILRGYEMASGLKINFAKSYFGIFGLHDAAQFFNCTHMDTPFHYLGMPIGVKPSSWVVWEPLISKFKAKLSKWNHKNLSMGDKVTLIKSVLNALPIYLLSFFKIPQRIVDKLLSLQRNFMWGGNQDHKKIPSVKWDVICLPKNDGGLGIKDLSKFNATLTGTWIWDLSFNQHQLWVTVLNSKYGGWSDLQNGRDKGWHSQWWKDLRKLNQQSDFNIIHQNMAWKVGCGDKINLCKDNWLGEDCSLQQKYHQLFFISRQHNFPISKMENFSQNIWNWDLKVKKETELEHLRAMSKLYETIQARKFEDLENSHKSSTVTLASIKESLGMDVDQKSLEQLIKKNGWWTKSSWAFLNEPPVIEPASNNTKDKAQNQSNFEAERRLKSKIECNIEVLEEAQQLWNLGKSIGMEADTDHFDFIQNYANMESRDRKEAMELETKRDSFDKAACQALSRHPDIAWEWHLAVNTAAGLLCVWNNKNFQVDFRIFEKGFIMLEGVWLVDMQRVVVANIYAPCDIEGKRQLWQSLSRRKIQSQVNCWYLVGDFNCVRHPSERMGSNHSNPDTNLIAKFNDWLAAMEVDDIPCVGKPFTWVRPNGSCKSKLDRVLVSDEWLTRLNKWNHRTLPLFFMSFFRAPTAVINRLTAIERNFLWGGNLEGKKIAWCVLLEKGEDWESKTSRLSTKLF
ncbi:putative ribonuclease H protein [Glycine soja]